MLRLSLFLFLLTFILPLSAQNDFRTGQKAWVLAKSGLNVRERAGTGYAKTGKLKYGAEVRVLDARGEKLEIEGIPGDWVKVEIGELKGYVFDGFLSVFPPPASSEEYPPVKEWLSDFAKTLGAPRTEKKVLDEGEEWESIQNLTFQDYEGGLTYSLEEDDMSISESVFLPGAPLENAFLLGKQLDKLYKDFSLGKVEEAGSWHEEGERGNEVQYLDLETEQDSKGRRQKIHCRVHILGSYTWLIVTRQEKGSLLEMGSRAD